MSADAFTDAELRAAWRRIQPERNPLPFEQAIARPAWRLCIETIARLRRRLPQRARLYARSATRARRLDHKMLAAGEREEME